MFGMSPPSFRMGDSVAEKDKGLEGFANVRIDAATKHGFDILDRLAISASAEEHPMTDVRPCLLRLVPGDFCVGK